MGTLGRYLPKLVDLDPDQQGVSQIWGMKVGVGPKDDPDLQGDYEPAAFTVGLRQRPGMEHLPGARRADLVGRCLPDTQTVRGSLPLYARRRRSGQLPGGNRRETHHDPGPAAAP